jgi:hypothetical protein
MPYAITIGPTISPAVVQNSPRRLAQLEQVGAREAEGRTRAAGGIAAAVIPRLQAVT